MDQEKQNGINQLMADFAVYLNPDLMKAEYSEAIRAVKFNKEKMEEYLQLLADIHYAWQKVLKYEVFFTDFYPESDSIEKFEALNHHIHAYLQDMTILKNKIEVFLNTLKNDIRKTADNKGNVDAFFKAGTDKNREIFDNISKHRDPHHHKGMRFFDGDLLKAENAYRAKEAFQNPAFDEMLNPEHKPELMQKFEDEQREGFEAAKTRWVGIAETNATQTSGYLDELMKAIRPPMYDFLGIKPVQEYLGGESP
jgi:hypothetical protein